MKRVLNDEREFLELLKNTDAKKFSYDFTVANHFPMTIELIQNGDRVSIKSV